MAYQLLKHTTVIGSRRLASTTIRHEVAIASRHHINVTSRHGVNITSVYGRANVRWFRATAYASGILKSKLPELAIPTDVSLAEYVMSDFDHHGDSVAMVEGVSNKSYTYRQLKDLVHRCGSGLSKAGFQQGDVCALFKPNMPEYFISFYSVAAIGGTITTVNPLYSADEFMHQLNDCKATWIVTSTDNSDKAKDAAKKTTHPVKGIYVIGDECVGGCIPFTDLMKDDGSAFPTNVQINPMEDVVALPYSSGTTGLPKGVMLTHHNLIANIEQMKSPGLLDFKAGDTLISVVPFFHIYGMAVILSNGLKLGTKLITLPKFEPEQFLQTIETYKVNHGMLVPPLMVFLAKHPLVDQYDLSSLEFVLFGAAPIGGDVINAVKKRLKNDTLFFRQAYGLTETSPIATMCSAHHDFHIGSVGLLVANSDAKVIDTKTGETLGVGENGELCFRGPHVMKGYLKNEKATKATLKDGWLHSGDLN
uniref:4-coumarate--CoA ligase 1-like n=1 Tax=Saccoglossus kowalevskii TaxID=10224 RepID=A0ABM0MHT3_SACKO|nr:PREDICTED: 4-coumarate--CoA ligase 1-like [Saccoglossus kowalevskii]